MTSHFEAWLEQELQKATQGISPKPLDGTSRRRLRIQRLFVIGTFLVIAAAGAASVVGIMRWTEEPRHPMAGEGRASNKESHPSGTVAFLSSVGPGDQQGVFVNEFPEGRPELLIRSGSSSRVRWSRDGRLVAVEYGGGQEQGGIAIVRVDQRRVIDVVKKQGEVFQGPDWSPDETLAFYSQSGHLWIAEEGRIAAERTPDRCFDSFPVWDWTGHRLAYIGRCGRRGSQIFIWNLRTGQVHQVTDIPPSWTVGVVTLDWSQGGGFVFAGNRAGSQNIYTVPPSGGPPQQLTRATPPNDYFDPSWSPDGRFIVFGTNGAGNEDIWMMRADGSDKHALITGPGSDLAPAWRPEPH